MNSAEGENLRASQAESELSEGVETTWVVIVHLITRFSVRECLSSNILNMARRDSPKVRICLKSSPTRDGGCKFESYLRYIFFIVLFLVFIMGCCREIPTHFLLIISLVLYFYIMYDNLYIHNTKVLKTSLKCDYTFS